MTLAEFAEKISPQLSAVLVERIRQDELWGEQNCSEGDWMLILQEEIGEWAQAVLDRRYKKLEPENVRTELVQFVAVGLAMLECCDRNGWHHPLPPGD